MAGERGQATIESAGLAALIALILIAVIAAIVGGGEVKAGRDLAGAIGRRIACAPHLPDACRHDPLVPAYGWPLARLTRALAPGPEALPGPDGLPLVPVDFRRCRRESCAVAAGSHLTASNRRTTDFTQLLDRRDARARSRSSTGSTGHRSGGDPSAAPRPRPTSRPPPAPTSSPPRTRSSSRSRRSPAATTTASPPTKPRPGNGTSNRATPAGPTEHVGRA